MELSAENVHQETIKPIGKEYLKVKYFAWGELPQVFNKMNNG